MYAPIDAYEGFGCRTFCGWLQIVSTVRYKSNGSESDTDASLDTVPSMEGSAFPFFSVGNWPQIFDTPCHKPRGLFTTAFSPYRKQSEELVCGTLRGKILQDGDKSLFEDIETASYWDFA